MEINTYPWCIRRRSILGHIFRGKVRLIVREIQYIEAASNRSRAAWKIINKESGIRKVQNDEIKLKIGKEIISNPTEIAEK